MYHLKIFSVGKTKKSYWNAAIEHYTKLLRGTLHIERIWVKDASGLPIAERKKHECTAILKKISPRDYLVALHEHGQTMDSPRFAQKLQSLLEEPSGDCCLVVGGAYGLSAELLERANTLFSLSPLTMPHELALVVLYEQLFRATTIMTGKTYHY